jgi:hypoxia up-regulated 1
MLTKFIGTKQLNTIVFPAGSKLDAKKTLTLKNKEDFLMKFGYKDTRLGYDDKFTSASFLPNHRALTNIFSVEFEGIKEALGNMTERLNGSSEPAVKITVELDSNGFVKIVDAVVWGDVKESLTGASTLNDL